MASLRGRGAWFGLALLGAGILMAPPPGAAQATGSDAAGDALSRNLRTLAENPRSLHALMGAGRAALELGDAQAAFGFFARAEEQAPRDGRIKMWMASALVQLEQPAGALRLFREAVALGAAEADVARDRGLAFDLSGDPRRAQRDYELVLRRGRDAEVTRRLALSLAISGERERSLQLLEEQLLLRDRAAERTRALVLALTGDADGAARAVQASMPGPQGAAMAPFLARLPTLSAADRARAVHLGHFPGDGRAPAATPAQSHASLDPALRAGAPDSAQPSLARPAAPLPDRAAPRRRPGGGDGAAAAAAGRAPEAAAPAPAASPDRQPQRRAVAPPVAPAASAPAGRPPASTGTRPASTRPPQPAEAGSGPAQPPAAAPAQAKPAGRLADLAAALAAIDEQAPPARGAAASASRAAAPPPARRERAAPTPAAAKKPAPPREPSRQWVQIAGGANRSTLPREFTRLRGKAPKLLGSRAAWTTAANATNRLLVGPFASPREAQAFVNELAKADVDAFAWASEAGQKVERLPAK